MCWGLCQPLLSSRLLTGQQCHWQPDKPKATIAAAYHLRKALTIVATLRNIRLCTSAAKHLLLQGLEVEVQRLINRHRAELEAAHERAAEQVKAAQEQAKAEQEVQLHSLRGKLRKVS